jgi:TonB family protein
MNPHRGSLRVPWLASLPCMAVLALGLSAFGQTPAEPGQQPPTAAQPAQPPATPAQSTQPAQQPATTPQPAQQTPPAPTDSQQSTPAQPSQQPATPAQPATPDTQQPAAPAQAPTATPANPAPATPAPADAAPNQQPSSPTAAPASVVPAAEPQTQKVSANDQQTGGITEEELKQMLVGKTFYLRGGYTDDSLSFNEHGKLASHSPVGSYTLNMIEIDKVHLSKHKVELDGLRYGLHFSNQLAFEDPRTAYDKVRITPKKKVLHISIDRESVVKPKKDKEKETKKQGKPAPTPVVAGPAKAASASPTGTQAPAAQPASAAEGQPAQPAEEPDTEQAKAEIAAAKPEERPADPDSVTSTTSPAHATMVLKKALDVIFAPGLDDGMMAALPDFWKLYYKAVADKTDYRPSDPTVLRQSTVDKKARLLSTFEPDSNQFAQDNGVAGMALYHTVIGPDGVPGEIAVARPIGFGLDENAVKAIRAAKFEPAEKDGKPVPVLLDLVVQFRIYSKRTNVKETPEEASKPAELVLPGPYSVQRPPAQPQQSQQ